MADIKQAAIWIEQGAVARRQAWHYEGPWDGMRVNPRAKSELLGRVGLRLEDLLADDWEIA